MTDRDHPQTAGKIPVPPLRPGTSPSGAPADEWLPAAATGLASVPRADTDDRLAELRPAQAASPADYLDMSRDEALAALQARWGTRWEIWYVRCYVPPDRWSARPWGAPLATVTARSPRDLDAGLAEAEQPGDLPPSPA